MGKFVMKETKNGVKFDLKAGNGEFRAAAEQTRAVLDKMDLPELRYFCENFLGSFALTLDEME